MIETLVGGLLGGILRLVPEFIAYFKAKTEQAHELAMTDRQIEHAKVVGQFKIEEVRQQGQNEYDASAVRAIQAAAEAQAKPTGVRFVDAINALIRPIITLQWVILLYPAAVVASFTLACLNGVPALVAIGQAFGPEEKALTAGIINFWFLNRVFEKVRR